MKITNNKNLFSVIEYDGTKKIVSNKRLRDTIGIVPNPDKSITIKSDRLSKKIKGLL